MKIDKNLILHLENLSHLSLTDNEREQIRTDLQKILGRMDRLSDADTDAVDIRPDSYNPLRDDEVGCSFERESILSNAPSKDDRMIIVPRVIE